jgi:PAS domain S-box-containing protein
MQKEDRTSQKPSEALGKAYQNVPGNEKPESLHSHRTHEHLEKLVDERLAEIKIINRQLNQEISQRMQAEETSRSIAREWRDTLDAVQDAIWLMDTDQNIIRCNQATTRLFKEDYKKIVGKKCYELFHDTTRPVDGCPFLRMYKSKKRETTVLSKNNHWFKVSLNPLKNNAGKITGVIHIVADITHTKKGSEALKESEERYRNVFTGAKDIISTIDSEGIIVSLNPAFGVLSGWPADEWHGRHCTSLVHPDEVPDIVVLLDNARSGKKIIQPVVVRLKTNSNSYKTVELLATRLYSRNKLTGFLVIARDITSRAP